MKQALSSLHRHVIYWRARRALPREPRLRTILKEMLEDPGEPEIIQRRVCLHGTFPKERVRCRLSDGSELDLFLKYPTPASHDGHGHRGGLDHEARVYHHVLQSVAGLTPRFFGTASKVALGAPLVLGTMEGFNSLRKARVSELVQAVRWAAEFHRQNEAKVSLAQLSFLRPYDRAYYAGWSQRTFEFSRPLHAEFPWVADLCRRFEAEMIPALLRTSTIIHGEFTVRNLMIRDGDLCPTDWESAAIGPGEIDLAMLLDGWPAPIVEECAQEYRRTRWLSGAPSYHQACFDAARIYVQLRWLGDKPRWTVSEKGRWRFLKVHAITQQQGVLQHG